MGASSTIATKPAPASDEPECEYADEEVDKKRDNEVEDEFTADGGEKGIPAVRRSVGAIKPDQLHAFLPSKLRQKLAHNSVSALSFAVRMMKSRAILLSSRLVIATFVIWLLSRPVRNHKSSYAIDQGD